MKDGRAAILISGSMREKGLSDSTCERIIQLLMKTERGEATEKRAEELIGIIEDENNTEEDIRAVVEKMMNEFPPPTKTEELFQMCRLADFSIERAKEIIGKIDINEPFSQPEWRNDLTTFLYEACLYNNLNMVRLLLENGANPNFIINEDKQYHQENAFWELQYNVYSESFYEENEKNKKIAEVADEDRLEIARLCLEYGANPNMKLEGEDLMTYVISSIVEDDMDFRMLEYQSRFLILLIAYGGKTETYQPIILKPFDKNNMKQYEFIRFGRDKYSCISIEEIVDGNYETVAKAPIINQP